MRRIAMIVPIFFMLTACVQQPAYRVDPQMDSIVAGATQTAASSLLSATAVAREATRQAVVAQAAQEATATRAAYEATTAAAQAAQETAVAIIASETAVAATATAQHQAEVNTLLGEETRMWLSINGTREAISTNATATAVKRTIDDDLARRQRRRTWGNIATGGVTVLLLLLGAAAVWRIHKGGQAFFNDSGQLVAIERPFGGIVVLPIRQRSEAVVIDAPPPVNNMPRPQAPREIPGTVNGQQRTFAVQQDDEVKPETWRALAVALLVHCANFSRNGVREHTDRQGWQWGDISQPEYNKAFQFMEKNGYLKPGRGAENNLTDKGYDWLARWIPNSLTLTLPYPEETAVDQATR